MINEIFQNKNIFVKCALYAFSRKNTSCIFMIFLTKLKHFEYAIQNEVDQNFDSTIYMHSLFFKIVLYGKRFNIKNIK